MADLTRRTVLQGAGVTGLAAAISALGPAAAAAAGLGAIERVNVFHRGQDGYHEFRPPTLVRATDGTLLAFAGGLVGSGGDFGHHDTVLKRSHDGGRTWQPLQVIATDPPNKLARCPVVDAESGRIHLMIIRTAGYVTGGDLSGGKIPPQDQPRPFYMYSDDHGATWSDWRERELTDVLKVPEMRHYVIGPSAGLQLTTGPYLGRLVLPGNHNFLPVPGERGLHTAYSDDNGETWHLGGPIGAYTRPDIIVDETALVERSDGTLYVNTRDQFGTASGNRAATTSSDGGVTLDAPFEIADDLITPIVSCAMTAVPGRRGRPRQIVFTGPQHPTAREQLTIRTSLDDGGTWRQGPLLHDGPASYSCPIVFTDDHRGDMLGVLFENGPRVSPDGRISYRYALDFVRVPLSLLNAPLPSPTTSPDVSGHGRHAVIGGQPKRIAGRFGRALGLAGDTVEVPLTDGIRVGAGPFAVAAWFRTEVQDDVRLVEAFAWGSGQPNFRVDLRPDRVIGVVVTDNGSATVTASANVTDGAWHHVVLTRGDDGGVALYLDGEYAAAGSGALGSVSADALGGIRFGARNESLDDLLIGGLDECHFFGRALTADEVGALRATNAVPSRAALVSLPLDQLTGAS